MFLSGIKKRNICTLACLALLAIVIMVHETLIVAYVVNTKSFLALIKSHVAEVL